MYPAVRNVATSRFLDPDMFQEFAELNREKFGVTGEGENIVVGTWNVNELVDAFKAHLGDEYPQHRQQQIELQQGVRLPGM
jgi:hypothetical protein